MGFFSPLLEKKYIDTITLCTYLGSTYIISGKFFYYYNIFYSYLIRSIEVWDMCNKTPSSIFHFYCLGENGKKLKGRENINEFNRMKVDKVLVHFS